MEKAAKGKEGEKIVELQEKAPLIDLGTDFYEGADVVEIDMGISYNSSINNDSILNSKNHNDENLKKSKMNSSSYKKNILNSDLEIFEGSLQNINDEGKDDYNENENSINEFKLKVNIVDDIKEKKNLIDNLDEIYIEADMEKSSLKKKLYENNKSGATRARGIQSSPSTKNFLHNNLNTNNNIAVKYLKTNFESMRNVNSNINLNSNKNVILKKSTTKNSLVNNTKNTIKSVDNSNTNNFIINDKGKEKFPHSKTLKILKNNHLNFMNNAFKLLSETQSNLNYQDKFEKAKTLMSFSKEKDNKQALSFRSSKKSNNNQLKNLTSFKKEDLQNSKSTKPFQQAFSKKKIIPSDNLNNLETKKTTSKNRNLLSSNKLIFNTTTDLNEEMKKPYSQDKNLSKRKLITDKSLNKKDMKNSIFKKDINNYTIKNEQLNKNKTNIYSNSNKKNQLIMSKKKIEKGKTNNFTSISDKKLTDRISSDITFISNKNVKDSNINNNQEKKISNRKSVSNNPLSQKNNNVSSNPTTNLNINCTNSNTHPNNNNNTCVFTLNKTIGNDNQEKNFNTVKSNYASNNNMKQSINKPSHNNFLNNEKKATSNYTSSNNNNNNNINKNQRENSNNQKLNHNVSQKYLKQFFSSLSKNTIIGNVNVNISNSNLKITQNMPVPQNANFSSSFKSNQRNSDIPAKNNIEISFESNDEVNFNEDVFIEDVKLTKKIQTVNESKRKSFNSSPLIEANKAINKMLNRPVSEYKLINMKDYTLTEDINNNVINHNLMLNSSENFGDFNVQSKNHLLTEHADYSRNSKNNFNLLKNNLSGKHSDRIDVNLFDKNTGNNQIKGRVNNTYRNTLNFNLNGKKNLFSNNNNNNLYNTYGNTNYNMKNFERANTFSNQKV